MVIGTCTIELGIPGNGALERKRRVNSRLMDG